MPSLSTSLSLSISIKNLLLVLVATSLLLLLPHKSIYPLKSEVLLFAEAKTFDSKNNSIQHSTNMSSTTSVSSAEKTKGIKTIYLIRHAESEENRRIGCFKSSVKRMGKFQLPKKQDIVASMELLNVSAQIDSNVSDIGLKQVSAF